MGTGAVLVCWENSTIKTRRFGPNQKVDGRLASRSSTRIRLSCSSLSARALRPQAQQANPSTLTFNPQSEIRTPSPELQAPNREPRIPQTPPPVPPLKNPTARRNPKTPKAVVPSESFPFTTSQCHLSSFFCRHPFGNVCSLYDPWPDRADPPLLPYDASWKQMLAALKVLEPTDIMCAAPQEVHEGAFRNLYSQTSHLGPKKILEDKNCNALL